MPVTLAMPGILPGVLPMAPTEEQCERYFAQDCARCRRLKSPVDRALCWGRAQAEYGSCLAEASRARRAKKITEDVNETVDKLNELFGGTVGSGATIGTGGTVVERGWPSWPSGGFGSQIGWPGLE